MGLIFIILVVGLVAWLLTQGQVAGRCHTVARTTVQTETPLEILRQRYARGEIDRDEYESRKRDLS
ncbi:MAG: SHOCT domain-containing protein [Actinobacteria bacterium]|nr:SHOCT domain-containing protein [Actinomycetota bacterium]